MKYIHIDVPVDGYYYVPVFFWKKKRHFRKAVKCEKTTDACFMHLNTPLKHYPLLGELHFVRGYLGAGMAAHEITHVALNFAEMRGIDDEEFVCETAQIITSNLWNMIFGNKKLRKFLYG